MHLKATLAVVAVALAGTLAQAAPADQDQMMAELKALKAEVAELRAAQNDSWMNERRAEEVKTLVRDVLADADTRAAMLDSAIVAGHDGEHFFLASENGEFQLNLAGLFQTRYVANFRDDSGADDGETGFEIRRAKFQPQGHVTLGGRKIEFFLSIHGDENSAEPLFEEYYVQTEILPETMPGLMLRGGRFRQPFGLQNLTDGAHQMAVDRSVVSEFFRVDRSEGVQVSWQNDMVRLTGAINDGVLAGGSDFTDASDIAFTGRADVLLMGEWSQFADPGVAWSGEPTGLQIGAAGHYEVGESGDATLNNNFFMWTADAAFETQGFGILVAGYGRHEDDDDAAPAGTEYDDFGILAEAGYMVIPDTLQPFVRYEAVMLDEDRPIAAGDEDTVQFITLGANWFLEGHKSKFTLDAVIGLDPVDIGDLGFVTLDGLGLLGDANGEDGQLAIRAQYQLKW